MRAVLVLAALAACSHKPAPDERIATEYRPRWDARGPAMPRTPCPDHDAVTARMTPLVQLAVDARKVWPRYDAPLPADLAARLDALAVPATAPEDLRCLLADPTSKPAGWEVLSATGALLEQKAERATDWPGVIAALHLFRDAPAFQYIYFFQPAYLMERATKLAAAHPPPAELRPALIAAAHDATMPPARLCAGLSEELLVQGANLFYGHLVAMRAQFIERWGPELGELYTDEYARSALPSYAAWHAYTAVWDTLATCTTTPPADLRATWTPLVAELKKQNPGAGMILEVTASRLDADLRLLAAERAFVAALAP